MKSSGFVKNISFSYSGIDGDPNAILINDNDYFCSSTNKADNANYFVVELKDRIFSIKGYLIKSYNDPNYHYLRSWKLYGSLFGDEWKLQHEIDDKDDLKSATIGRYRTKKGCFRFFKIVQTGPNRGTEDVNKYRLRISYLDLFGHALTSVGNEQTCKAKLRRLSFSVSLSLIVLCS